MKVQIDYVSVLHPIFTKPKRVKIIVGGRGSSKSTAIADYVAVNMMRGQLWCCARENQNSIEESVHRTILDEIDRLQLHAFEETKTSITHPSGGRTFYRGLSRNITSLKSTLSGIDGLWIEEGEDISANTLRVLTASVRLNAKDSQRLIQGEDVKMPEIIITMNRGTRAGAVAQKWLLRAEQELQKCGYYEDENVMIAQMNYTDMPKEWFQASGLEGERQDDYKRLSRAMYRHKWLGDYLDEVDDSIILPEWFDAALDAHKLDRLKKVFQPHGAIISSHDPSDTGEDDKGYACRHGSIIKSVRSRSFGGVDEGCDWAISQAVDDKADWFLYDADGMGAGLKRQVNDGFRGKSAKIHAFRGGLSGVGQDNGKKKYMGEDKGDSEEKPKTYAETFKNNRAQYYFELARRLYNTYRCVERGEYISPDDMISFDSDGIDSIDSLRSEICRIPRKFNSNGLYQIMSKVDMKKLDIKSPNMSDSIMMTMYTPSISDDWDELDYPTRSIV